MKYALQKHKIRFYIFTLAFTEFVTWGSIYFVFSLFIDPIKYELAWTPENIIMPFSMALVVSGLSAVIIGKCISQRNGYLFLMGGSLVTAILFFMWSKTNIYVVYYIIWFMMGISMRAIFSSIYAIIVVEFKDKAHRIVIGFTLFTAFSSTIFIPTTNFLIEQFGWRNTLLILGGLNFFCASLQFLAMPKHLKFIEESNLMITANYPKNEKKPLTRALRTKHFWALTIAFMSTNIISTALCVHLLPMLLELGYEMNVIVKAIALIGPTQVIVRFLLLKNSERFSMRTICVASMLTQFLAILVLCILSRESWLLALFTILYGLGTGMATTVGVLAALEFFGATNYSTIQGALHIPATIARASAPILVATILTFTGVYKPIIWFFLIIAGSSALAFTLLTKKGNPFEQSQTESSLI